jgi:tetratricopeptide (TPR) repeat protein
MYFFRYLLRVLFLVIIPISIFSLNIEIKVGKSSSKYYSVYHIKDDIPFYCKSKININDGIEEYICKINSNPNLLDFKKENYTLANIWFNKNNNNLFLHIQPLKKSIIYPIYEPLYSVKKISNDKKEPSKVWSIYMFENNNTIFKAKKDDKGLDFDIFLTNNPRPFIGPLDIDKKPLISNMNNEVKSLVELQDFFINKRFKAMVNMTNKLGRIYPNSTFKGEIELYKLRGLDGIDLEKNAFILLEEAKQWLLDNPSNEDIPEVLFYMAKAQSKISRNDLAEISFRKIVERHPKHKFALLSKIYLGEILEDDDDIFASIKLYKSALYETDDMEVALLAAKRIADKSLSDNIYREAKVYYEKILDKKENYILEDVDSAYQLARKLRLKGLEDVAGRIIEALSKRVDRESFPEKHEEYIFEAAQLFSSSDVNKSIYYFQEYINLYPDGVNLRAARRELDLLLLAKDEERTPIEQLDYLDYIIKTYPGTEIAQIALYKKAKILFKDKNYDFLLKNEEKLKDIPVGIAPDIEELIIESARLFVLEGIANNSCEMVVNNVVKYKLVLKRKHHMGLYKCLITQFRYDKAEQLAQENIEKGGDDQLFWLSSLEKILYSQQKYKEVIKIAKEILDMSKLDNNTSYNDVWYDVFDSNLFLGKTNELLKVEQTITKLFPKDLRTSDIYKPIIKIAQKNKDDFLIIDMSKKIFKIQDIFKSYDDSPWVDYSYIKSLININRFKAALISVERIEKLVRSKKIRVDTAKLAYTKSRIYQNLDLKKEQEIELNRCAETNSSKVWSTICRNTLKWL